MSTKMVERNESMERLHEWVKPGDTVYTILRHVARSGMMREIGVLVPIKGSDSFRHPNYAVATVCGYRIGKRDGLIAHGGGMDMGFEVVYNLGRAMFPDGFGELGTLERADKTQKPLQRRPKTRAEASRMVAAGWKFHGRNGDTSGWDNDGGYALTHRWL